MQTFYNYEFELPINDCDKDLYREFLLSFSRCGRWIDRFTNGYTHVKLGQLLPGEDREIIWFNPTFETGLVYLQSRCVGEKTKGLYVSTVAQEKQAVCRFGIQTCATLVQYLMGINLGVWTPQGLYNELTMECEQRLYEQGVQEVRPWASQLALQSLESV